MEFVKSWLKSSHSLSLQIFWPKILKKLTEILSCGKVKLYRLSGENMSLSQETVNLLIKTLTDSELKAGEFIIRDEHDQIKCVAVIAIDEKATELQDYCQGFFAQNIEEESEDNWVNQDIGHTSFTSLDYD